MESKGVIKNKIGLAALTAVLAANAANLLVWAVLKAVIGFDGQFQPLQAGPIAIFTTLGVAAAGLVYALTVRFAMRPIPTYRRIALAALVLSIIPNLGLMFNPAAAPFPGGSALNFGLLILFHVVAAVAAVQVLIGMTRQKA